MKKVYRLLTVFYLLLTYLILSFFIFLYGTFFQYDAKNDIPITSYVEVCFFLFILLIAFNFLFTLRHLFFPMSTIPSISWNLLRALSLLISIIGVLIIIFEPYVLNDNHIPGSVIDPFLDFNLGLNQWIAIFFFVLLNDSLFQLLINQPLVFQRTGNFNLFNKLVPHLPFILYSVSCLFILPFVSKPETWMHYTG